MNLTKKCVVCIDFFYLEADPGIPDLDGSTPEMSATAAISIHSIFSKVEF